MLVVEGKKGSDRIGRFHFLVNNQVRFFKKKRRPNRERFWLKNIEHEEGVEEKSDRIGIIFLEGVMR